MPPILMFTGGFLGFDTHCHDLCAAILRIPCAAIYGKDSKGSPEKVAGHKKSDLPSPNAAHQVRKLLCAQKMRHGMTLNYPAGVVSFKARELQCLKKNSANAKLVWGLFGKGCGV